MKEIIVIKDNFTEAKNLVNFFIKKKIDSRIIDRSELLNFKSPKSTLICSKEFESQLDGKNNLTNLGRNIGSSKIVILKTNSEKFEISEELGGSYVSINNIDFDECFNELLVNIISNQNFSYSDPKTHSLISLAKRVAETDVTVFVHGPTGTGKEVISNYIHKQSRRKDNPFIAVNCAAIPENMLEAMLFGHEKGAFTGASSANKGIFRAADSGSLLLDEISEMPLSLQAKLLRVLQEKKVTPIGGQRDIDVDVRVIATTNRNMVAEVNDKKFREDLYYRLNVFPIETTNLRERPGDIIPISMSLLKRHSKTNNEISYISSEAQEILKSYTWPGNVRELENVLQRAIVLSDDNIIKSRDIMIDNMLQDNFTWNELENREKQAL